MTLAQVTIVALQASIFATVFCLGLEATLQDALSLFRRPRALLRALLAINVVMPVFAATLAAVFSLKPVVEVALVLLAVSPIPPILPQQQLKAGGSSSYIYGLLVAAGILSIVFVPVSIQILGLAFSRNVHISPMAVAEVVTMTILLPLGLGILVHWRAPGFARRRGRLLAFIAAGLLLVSIIPLLIVAGREMLLLIGNGTLLAMIAFTVVGLAAGHGLGRPDPGEQTTLALATASRHPGLAIVIAATNFPAQKKQIAAAILLYLVVRTLVVLPYSRRRKRHGPSVGQRPQPEHRRSAA
jgi:BASS family bile acid:Na+ symporter